MGVSVSSGASVSVGGNGVAVGTVGFTATGTGLLGVIDVSTTISCELVVAVGVVLGVLTMATAAAVTAADGRSKIDAPIMAMMAINKTIRPPIPKKSGVRIICAVVMPVTITDAAGPAVPLGDSEPDGGVLPGILRKTGRVKVPVGWPTTLAAWIASLNALANSETSA